MFWQRRSPWAKERGRGIAIYTWHLCLALPPYTVLSAKVGSRETSDDLSFLEKSIGQAIFSRQQPARIH
jgi:hypothetical protein